MIARDSIGTGHWGEDSIAHALPSKLQGRPVLCVSNAKVEPQTLNIEWRSDISSTISSATSQVLPGNISRCAHYQWNWNRLWCVKWEFSFNKHTYVALCKICLKYFTVFLPRLQCTGFTRRIKLLWFHLNKITCQTKNEAKCHSVIFNHLYCLVCVDSCFVWIALQVNHLTWSKQTRLF